ncbi:serine hydrolase, partial [Klebsiella pneumoniae]|uniref:serine hydrolase n=1 Tax=Klebsiella pneumoniae TaxID=573 RepID=UPI003EDEB1DA
ASSVDAVLKEALAKKQTVGAGVVVVKGGRVVYAEGYGLADREKKTPATEHTRFEIGSVTKQFAATILMQLVGEHKVDLDAPIT